MGEAPAQPPSGLPRGNPTLTLGVLLALMFLLLASLEVGARLLLPAEPAMVGAMPFLVDHPTQLWRLRPGYQGEPWPGVSVQISQFGLRDEAQPQKAPGSFRVLSLGESTAWGFRVAAQDTYAEVLEAELSSAFPQRTIEVVNGGVPAWSIVQSAQFLQEEGESWQPDLLLIAHLMNDHLPRGPSNPRDPFQVSLSDAELIRSRRPLSGVLGIFSRSRLRAWAWEHLSARMLAQAPQGTDVPRASEAERRAAWASIVDWAGTRAVPLIVVKPVYGRGRHAEDRLLWEISRSSAGFVDLPQAKQAQNLPDAMIFTQDETHPTSKGHAWIATQVLPILQPLVPTLP
jgi:lysophospholipase L1-like esterase